MKIPVNVPHSFLGSEPKAKNIQPTNQVVHKVEVTGHRFLPFQKCIKVKHEGKTYRVKASQVRKAFGLNKTQFSKGDIQKLCRLAKNAAENMGEEFTLQKAADLLNVKEEKLQLLANLVPTLGKNKELSYLLVGAAHDQNIDLDTLKVLSKLRSVRLSSYSEACNIQGLENHRSQIINLLSASSFNTVVKTQSFIEEAKTYENLDSYPGEVSTALKYVGDSRSTNEKVKIVTQCLPILNKAASRTLLKKGGTSYSEMNFELLFKFIAEKEGVTKEEILLLNRFCNSLENNIDEKARQLDLYAQIRPFPAEIRQFLSRPLEPYAFMRYMKLAIAGADVQFLKELDINSVMNEAPLKILTQLVESKKINDHVLLGFANTQLSKFSLRFPLEPNLMSILDQPNVDATKLIYLSQWTIDNQDLANSLDTKTWMEIFKTLVDSSISADSFLDSLELL